MGTNSRIKFLTLLILTLCSWKIVNGKAQTYNYLPAHHPEKTNVVILIKVEVDDNDCMERDISNSTYLRKPPCSYRPIFPRFGGRPWYWTYNVKPVRWDLFYNITV